MILSLLGLLLYIVVNLHILIFPKQNIAILTYEPIVQQKNLIMIITGQPEFYFQFQSLLKLVVRCALANVF